MAFWWYFEAKKLLNGSSFKTCAFSGQWWFPPPAGPVWSITTFIFVAQYYWSRQSIKCTSDDIFSWLFWNPHFRIQYKWWLIDQLQQSNYPEKCVRCVQWDQGTNQSRPRHKPQEQCKVLFSQPVRPSSSLNWKPIIWTLDRRIFKYRCLKFVILITMLNIKLSKI